MDEEQWFGSPVDSPDSDYISESNDDESEFSDGSSTAYEPTAQNRLRNQPTSQGTVPEPVTPRFAATRPDAAAEMLASCTAQLSLADRSGSREIPSKLRETRLEHSQRNDPDMKHGSGNRKK